MKAILNQLIQYEQLTSEQARQVIINIADGKIQPFTNCSIFNRIYDA
jgi:anthranilate phosphoribosyltransferase